MRKRGHRIQLPYALFDRLVEIVREDGEIGSPVGCDLQGVALSRGWDSHDADAAAE